ncbi:hypothetical protein [Terracidiphilus gabretensis]|jgi:hypothetical protein|uniref:hypothetical protein n=1 Tax=Terracidiphilus gabretensis TaxID=1577687 RepID=UPI0012F77C28|nr:hypothetical protein [Terracidiphilus gabretensis]
MGITIHYKGRIKGAEAFQHLHAKAAEFAAKHEWNFHDSVDGSEQNYTGFTVIPHPDC